MDLSETFKLTIPLWEVFFRVSTIYFLLLVLFRVTGKKQVGQLTPFDLVLLLIISNVVQNSMNAGDNSVTLGLIAAPFLIFLNSIMTYLIYRSKKLESILEGRPEILIHNGKVYENTLRRLRITHHELDAALREDGVVDIGDVHAAILENNGEISVIVRKDK